MILETGQDLNNVESQQSAPFRRLERTFDELRYRVSAERRYRCDPKPC